MNATTTNAFRALNDAANDTRTFSARDFELRPAKSRRNRDNTIATDADGTRWAWDNSREVWARTI